MEQYIPGQHCFSIPLSLERSSHCTDHPEQPVPSLDYGHYKVRRWALAKVIQPVRGIVGPAAGLWKCCRASSSSLCFS